MTERILKALAPDDAWTESGARRQTQERGGISIKPILLTGAIIALGAFALRYFVGDDLDYTKREPYRLPDPRKPGYDMYGLPFQQLTPRYPLDANATTLSGESGDGVAQSGERIGVNGEGELTADLERKQQIIKELVAVYQKAFAGFPWYEVTQCPQSPSGFSAQNIGEWCQCKGCLQSGVPTLLSKPAYPTEELYRSLRSRASDPQSTVYIERTSDGRAVLGAILRPMSEDTIVQKYQGRVDEEWLRDTLSDRVLWLDEIFADLDARPSGNLANLKEVIERSAERAGADTVAFRTINENLRNKVLNLYGSRAIAPTVPDTAGSGSSYLVIVKL